MNIVKSSLTIIFDPPFYKAVFERSFDSVYEVGQLNLGPSEPKIRDVYLLVTNSWGKINFSRQEDSYFSVTKHRPSLKRLQRLARKTVSNSLSTKAQIALQEQHESSKKAHKHHIHASKQVRQAQQFSLHQAKKLEKHKGH